MLNAGIIHYALFWNGNNGFQCAYFVNNGLRSAPKNRRFWISYIKWCTNSTIIIYWLFQGVNKRDSETWEPQTQSLSVNSIADSLGLKFLGHFAEMSS